MGLWGEKGLAWFEFKIERGTYLGRFIRLAQY